VNTKLATRPDDGSAYPCVLMADQATPRHARPVWFVRALSEAEVAEYRRAGDDAVKDRPGANRRCFAALRTVLVGWDNVRWPGSASGRGRTSEPTFPDDRDRLEELLTVAEAWELYFAGLARQELSGEDLGNSDTPSSTPGGGSAGGDAADAPTRPGPASST